MATNFPTSLDTLTNPLAGDPTTNPSHALQHANANDAIEALEAKVGINGSAVTTSLDYRMGLEFIKSQVVGTSVASVSVTDAFSSTFDNYRIIYTGGSGSLTHTLMLQFGVGAVFTTVNYFGGAGFVNPGAGVWQILTDNGTAQANYAGGGGTGVTTLALDVLMPNLAENTYFYGQFQQDPNGRFGHCSYAQLGATQFTSFRILASTGVLTGGTIRVYGYKN